MKQGQGIIGPVVYYNETILYPRLRAAFLQCHRTLLRTETQPWTTWLQANLFSYP
jgi:hypothetical protein